MSIRTLIVDDMVTCRKFISNIVSTIPEYELLGTAPSGSIALKKLLHTQTDLVLLDVYMEEMNGIETLKKIKEAFPAVAVVMMSEVSSRSPGDTVEALQNGAIDFISKPDQKDFDKNIPQLKTDLLSLAKLLQQSQPAKAVHSKHNTFLRSIPERIHDSVTAHAKRPLPTSFSICTIGVSTGGPEALNKLIPMLPANFPVPVLIVQHMPAYFTKSLAESLNKKSALTVIEAPENAEIRSGTVYIAPGGKHMIVRNVNGIRVIGYSDAPPENSCRPSADVLFRSVALHYGDTGVLSIILTGMGNDGCHGVRVLKKYKCYCITQSESSCVVYGMPRAVDEAGLSDQSLPLEQIPSRMQLLISKSSTFSGTTINHVRDEL